MNLRRLRPLCFVLVVSTVSLSLQGSRADAAIVTTESVIDVSRDSPDDRARVRAFLDRADVRARMQAYGVSADEARARVESLTDREIATIVTELDRLPAGGDGDPAAGALILLLGVVIVVILLVWGIVEGVKWISKRVASPPAVNPATDASE